MFESVNKKNLQLQKFLSTNRNKILFRRYEIVVELDFIHLYYSKVLFIHFIE